MKLINENLNEYYQKPKYKKNSFGWNVPILTFVDKVFDHICYIIEQENNISEKSFKEIDNIKNKLKIYFDNNLNIINEIQKFSNKRKEYCAEYIYDKFIKNNVN